MRKCYFLTTVFLFLWISGKSQGIVRGIVLAKDSEHPLPGVTVIVAGSKIGASTNYYGYFELAVPTVNSVLIFNYIGFKSQQVTVRTGDSVVVKLPVRCIQDYFYYRYVGVSLTSGIRYTPLGGQLTLFQPNLLYNDFMQPAARLELEYQTGSHNSYRTAALTIDELITTCSNFNLDIGLEYQNLQVDNPYVLFKRYSLGANIGLNKLPFIWLAVGRANYQEQDHWRIGVELGSQYTLVIKRRYGLDLMSRVAWWQTSWQWQNSISVERKRYVAAAVYRQIGTQYREVGIRLGVKLFIPNSKKTAVE
ncbi:carboxypeptidase-like regulatory domain-containing protein [Hymenobacter sp. YC55]|uniref:carboxypeptidase-like regulatory domain-containing protein n=1 Tax=Hymenobacter sp. YC55 TaxID=3034019 RepID=UPI0023F777B6|nr:carboxypeptidase-like regulatory domain-containing protein [Hymenobacter sp. YC55]MDF7810575.1 carboxypeptidase-like regulatory domain-containing protein [Hymenobacter sp. YC55]